MLLTPSRDTYVTADFPLTLYLFPEKEKKKKGREEGKGGGERGERGRGGGGEEGLEKRTDHFFLAEMKKRDVFNMTWSIKASCRETWLSETHC